MRSTCRSACQSPAVRSTSGLLSLRLSRRVASGIAEDVRLAGRFPPFVPDRPVARPVFSANTGCALMLTGDGLGNRTLVETRTANSIRSIRSSRVHQLNLLEFANVADDRVVHRLIAKRHWTKGQVAVSPKCHMHSQDLILVSVAPNIGGSDV
jgi:hypothetical protein